MPASDQVNEIVRAALEAPSGDNCQPWRFRWDGRTLDIALDPERAESLYDIRQCASWISLGATLVNIQVAARALGLTPSIRVLPEGEGKAVAARIALEVATPCSEPLFRVVAARCVNRRPYRSAPLAPDARTALASSIAQVPGVQLNLIEEAHARTRLAALAARNDRLLFENQRLHAGLFRWLRWTEAHAAQTRDGIPIGSLELSALERPGFRLLGWWPIARCLGTLGVTRGLALRTQAIYQRSAAIGLLSVDGSNPSDFVRGGEALERLWLTATLNQVAFQPITGITFLWLRMRFARGQGLSVAHQRIVERTIEEAAALVPALSQRTPIILFRLGYAQAPTARALRRSVETALTGGGP